MHYLACWDSYHPDYLTVYGLTVWIVVVVDEVHWCFFNCKQVMCTIILNNVLSRLPCCLTQIYCRTLIFPNGLLVVYHDNGKFIQVYHSREGWIGLGWINKPQPLFEFGWAVGHSIIVSIQYQTVRRHAITELIFSLSSMKTVSELYLDQTGTLLVRSTYSVH